MSDDMYYRKAFSDHLTQIRHREEELAAQRLAMSELEVENVRLRSVAQSRYELLRECQSEFKALGSKGLVETIEAALTRPANG